MEEDVLSMGNDAVDVFIVSWCQGVKGERRGNSSNFVKNRKFPLLQ